MILQQRCNDDGVKCSVQLHLEVLKQKVARNQEAEAAAGCYGQEFWSTDKEKGGNLVIMAALHSRCGHYIFALWFLLSIYLSVYLSIFFFV